MLLLVAAASILSFGPTSSASVRPRSPLRVFEQPAVATAEEWKRISPQARRRERIIKDERGELQLQRVFEYQ